MKERCLDPKILCIRLVDFALNLLSKQVFVRRKCVLVSGSSYYTSNSMDMWIGTRNKSFVICKLKWTLSFLEHGLCRADGRRTSTTLGETLLFIEASMTKKIIVISYFYDIVLLADYSVVKYRCCVVKCFVFEFVIQ